MIVHLLIHLLGGSMSMKANGCVVKRVHCERCGEEYIYQLRRTVSSSAYAFLHIGVAKKRLAVVQKAQLKLQRALQDGVDPVPCPACGWLQRNMVAAWRKRARKKIALAGMILTVAILLLWAVAENAEISPVAIAWTAVIALASLVIATVIACMTDRNGNAHRRTREVLGHNCRAMPAAEFDALLAEGA